MSRGLSEKQTKGLAFGTLGILALAAFFIWGAPAIGLYSQGGTDDGDLVVDNSTVAVTYDYYAFNVTEELTGELLEDITCTPYYVDATGMNEEEIDDLRYADFTAQTAVLDLDANDEFEIEDYEDGFVIFKMSHADCGVKWVYDIVEGLNNITMMNRTTDINIMGYERDGGSSTFADTNDREWVINVRAISDTYESKLGFEVPLYDFPNYAWNYSVCKLTWNTTAQYSFSDMPGAVNEVIGGNNTYFYFDESITSDEWNAFNLNIGSTLGSTFEAEKIEWGVGNKDSSITIYDSQV
ncbi:hypothetical protein [Candidatus Lokiarchaeum ossiferum]|uniref:hypothetical protein n=1 Tax=Candidatus Lokiarchaeum ossiferum TaxID=2951803 RepID=UPI00352F149D